LKILAISGSPREQGNTEILLNEALKGASQAGADVELFSVAGKTIGPCEACMTCRETGKCRIDDDMQDLYEKMLEADGIIFGTPIYLYAMTAQTKAMMDRSFALNHDQTSLANKVGGVVVVAASLGLLDAMKDIYFYFVSMQMLPANYVAAYGNYKGEVKELSNCLEATRQLGKQMVLLVDKKFKYPSEVAGSHNGYGTWIK
jgi:multimeric flavodoxin WrbA